MRTHRIPPVVMLAALAVTSSLAAQAREVVLRPRSAIGIHAALARPVGEFQNFVRWGGGFGLYGLINLDRGRHIGLRMDGLLVIYGHESFDAPLSSTVRRVWVDVDTDNMILALGIGPQITLGTGRFRPYVYGTAGFSYFATVSSVGGTAGYSDFASTTNFDDLSLALTGGGGVMLRLSRGRHPIFLDFSAQSTYNGEVEYLRRGGVRENPDGSLTLFPIRSETNLVTFRAGVAIGI
ncbi:MAG: hypothetical protein GTN78_00670 [Gemmatimonadales bacterium]|nr:hypothetical protein [Gemmatimonadales bacterium]NIN10052.1 hypothetical protein [Gemmatimonadales bacterium]NIQ98705.1 hypothetical protein [Gemmatimonadales bacterium]NIS63581.1 hypothetical protein [Gemmatimonadales bacterium]